MVGHPRRLRMRHKDGPRGGPTGMVAPELVRARYAPQMPDDLDPRFRRSPTAEEIAEAVSRTGYPLQRRVAAEMRALFPNPDGQEVKWFGSVSTEVPYVDSDSDVSRTSDLIIQIFLGRSTKVEFSLRLIVECKSSQHAFVFFPDEASFDANIAHLSGVAPIIVHFTEGKTTRVRDGEDVIGLDFHPFSRPDHVARLFTQFRRNGRKQLESSSEDVYRNVILPLSKATDYWIRPAPIEGWPVRPVTLVVAAVVVDAPLFISNGYADSLTVESAKRVRLHREWVEDGAGRSQSFDFVHVDALTEYITDDIIPFGLWAWERLRENRGRRERVLVDGEATCRASEMLLPILLSKFARPVIRPKSRPAGTP